MYGEPDGRLGGIGPLDSMTPASRNEEIIPRLQGLGYGIALEQKSRCAGDQKHPFGPSLLVPETRRTRLPGGDDALDPDSLCLTEFRKLFVRYSPDDLIEDVSVCSRHWLALPHEGAIEQESEKDPPDPTEIIKRHS